MDYFGAKLRKRYEFAIETKRASTLRNDRGSLHSFFAFPAIGPSVQSLPALHPFVVGSHRVLFRSVHCGLRLFNGWCLVLFVFSLLASRQQQGGRGRHCYYRDKGFLHAFHGMLLLHHLVRERLPVLQCDAHRVGSSGQLAHVDALEGLALGAH